MIFSLCFDYGSFIEYEQKKLSILIRYDSYFKITH